MILNISKGEKAIWSDSIDFGKKQRQSKLPNGRWFFFVLALLIGAVILMAIPDFLVETDKGPDLAPWRKEKLNKELREIDDAEQYVLYARVPGYYPCYHCPNGKTTIYLKVGEVWRYGVTRKKEKGRYPLGLIDERLKYFVQYRGTLSECTKEEKRKIYYYPLLPESLRRKINLIRPPGNHNDN